MKESTHVRTNSQKLEILSSIIHHGALVDKSAVKVNWLTHHPNNHQHWFTKYYGSHNSLLIKYHPLPSSRGRSGVYMYMYVYPVLLLGWNFRRQEIRCSHKSTRPHATGQPLHTTWASLCSSFKWGQYSTACHPHGPVVRMWWVNRYERG